MKVFFKILGILFIICGFLSFFILSFVLTSTPGESFARDLLGFSIHNPPTWTSYVPYIGSFLAFIFEFFSLHGLIEILIISIFASVGNAFLTLSKK